jgi:transposase-like protein
MADVRATVTLVCPQCGQSRTVLAKQYRDNCRRSHHIGLCRGCITANAKRTHGDARKGARPRIYGIWKGMRERCRGKGNADNRANYYDRGIRVCPEWDASYEAFRFWAILNGYRDDLQIDRIDNDGGYTPANCRWVTHAVNRQNSRSHCKYPREVVEHVYRLAAEGVSQPAIARMVNISTGYVSRLITGQSRDRGLKFESYAQKEP